jgi:hypothetical protein
MSIGGWTDQENLCCVFSNIKGPPQARVLIAWFPVGGVILRGSGNFRRWGLNGEGRSLKAGCWRYLVSSPFFSPCFLSAMECITPATCSCRTVFLPHDESTINGAKDDGLKPLKLQAIRNSPLFCCLNWVFLVTEKSDYYNVVHIHNEILFSH